MTEKDIALKLTKLYKDEILRQKKTTGHLYKTGALYKSIKVIVSGKNKYTLLTEDYFKYLDLPFNISQNVYNSSGFKEIKDNLVELYSESILKSILYGNNF